MLEFQANVLCVAPFHYSAPNLFLLVYGLPQLDGVELRDQLHEMKGFTPFLGHHPQHQFTPGMCLKNDLVLD